jgi:hypothetical protein
MAVTVPHRGVKVLYQGKCIIAPPAFPAFTAPYLPKEAPNYETAVLVS